VTIATAFSLIKKMWKLGNVIKSSDGAVVRALTFHQCCPGSIPGLGVICGLSLFMVLVLAPRGFSPGTTVFPSPQKPTFPNSNSIWISVSPICGALVHGYKIETMINSFDLI